MAKLVEVIKYEGDNSTFVWKHPVEDFNSATQLIVHESQEAIFFMNGQALDLFGTGRHTLRTQNLPLLSRVINRATGGKSPFHCELYFINKTDQMAIKWGTDQQVQFKEPTYHFPLQIGASGEMTIRVEDARRLLVKVVGTETEFTQITLTQQFRSLLMAHIKPYLAHTLQTGSYSIFEVDAHMAELSAALQTQLTPDFLEYGLQLERFFVVNIEEETQKQRTILEAEALAKKRELEGYSYQQEQSFDVAKKVAENEGAGNFSSAGIGLGVMGGIAGTMGGAMANVTQDALIATEGDSMTHFKQKMEKLLMMKEMNLLTDEEFAAEKAKLLNNL